MKKGELTYVKFLRSQAATTLLLAAGLIVPWLVYSGWSQTPTIDQTGAIATAPTRYVADPTTRGVLNQLMMVGAFIGLWIMNRRYSVLRTNSVIYVGLAGLAFGSVPMLTGASIGGALLALTVVVGVLMMYSIYDRKAQTPRVFLLFFLLGCGSCGQYAFLVYAPVFLIATAQMRCLTMRSLLAAIVGLIVPVWLLVGFGVIDLQEIRLPQLGVVQPRRMIEMYPPSTLVCAGVAIVAGIWLTLVNIIKVYGFNARSRALNGVLSILTLITAAMALVDWMRLGVYLPLLLCLMAMQATLYLRLNVDQRKGYLTFSTLILLYLCILIWNVVA